MRSYYNTAVYTARFFVHLHARFNKKSKKWVEGRKKIFARLKAEIGGKEKWVWFHASSVGEFEQGRPLIESFKNEFPNYRIILTFFSTSGFEAKKNYQGVDYVCYLPIDTPTNAHRFISILKPELAFFIKYDFWYNYLYELNKNKIPTFFISTVFRKNQYFFKSYGKWFRKHLKKIDWFFVQNEDSSILLNQFGIFQNSISGDTRFDRVASLSSSLSHYPFIEKFKGGSRLIIAGSTWEADEKRLLELTRIPSAKLLIVPHRLEKKHIVSLLQRFQKNGAKLYSALTEDTDLRQAKVLILDTMGMLSKIYHYADICYVGGGFGAGIHNLLEVAVYGKPVLFGPKHHKFKEATDLVKLKAGFEVAGKEDLLSITKRLLDDQDFYAEASTQAVEYIRKNQGATAHILQKVKDFIPSSNAN